MNADRELFDRRMSWLKSNGISICQRVEEFYQAWLKVKSLNATRFIEIGSCNGGSLYMYAAAMPCHIDIACIDLAISGSQYHKNLRFIISKLEDEGHRVFYCNADSRDMDMVMEIQLLMPEADFVHIDGAHTYDYSLADWQNYGTLVRKGGIVIFHDIKLKRKGTRPAVGVGKLWSELIAQGYQYDEFVQTENLGGKPVAGIGLLTI